jgi:hypothetical protein
VVEWNGEWVAFLDTVLQTSVEYTGVRESKIPTQIRKMVIFPEALSEYTTNNKGKYLQKRKTVNQPTGVIYRWALLF